jgi:hypothetical protein
VAGESVNNQIPAVERLQHQHVSNRGLGFARHRTEQQPARQRDTVESATNARQPATSASRRGGMPDGLKSVSGMDGACRMARLRKSLPAD